MDELNVYRCLRCDREFCADPAEIRNMGMTLCEECREKTNKRSGISDADKAVLISNAVAIGKKAVSAVAKAAIKSARETNKPPEADLPEAHLPEIVFRSKGPKVKTTQDVSFDSSTVKSFAEIIKDGIEQVASNIAYSSNEKADKDNYQDGWINIGNLYEAYLSGKLKQYSKYVGLYRHEIDGEIKYIGRAIEFNNGGFRKRLSDYCRDSNSARKHTSGQIIYANKEKITTYILIVGSDAAAAEKTKELEDRFIKRFNPPWNIQLKNN